MPRPFLKSSPSLSDARGFGAEWCCGSEPGVTKGPLVILTGPQISEADMNHPAVGEVSGCSLCAVTQPCDQGIFSHLWLHKGKEISTKPQTTHTALWWSCVCTYFKRTYPIAVSPGNNDAQEEYVFLDKMSGILSMMDDVLASKSTLRTVRYTQNYLLHKKNKQKNYAQASTLNFLSCVLLCTFIVGANIF